MRQEKTVSVRIEDAFLSKRCAYLDCKLKSARIIQLSIPFNDRAPRGSPAHNRWRLIVKLAEWHGMGMADVVQSNLQCISGKFYRFRLVLWGNDHWVIDAGKAIEPFEIFDPESDENVAELERALGIA